MRSYLVPGTALLAAAALFTGCQRSEPPRPAEQTATANTTAANEVRLPPDSPRRKRIALARVEARRVCTEEVTAPGKIEVNPARVSRVIMPVAGRVTKVMVGLGDAVQQGQPLLSIVSPEVSSAISNLRQAESRLRQSSSDVIKAQADLNRSKDLYEHHALAEKDVIAARAALAQATAGQEQAEATRSEGLRRLQIFGLTPGDYNQEIVVRASVTGKVLDLSVAPGEFRNDTSTPLMTIADLRTVFVSADVPEDRVRMINAGEAVEVKLTAWPAEVFHGRVAKIADTVDPQTRTVKVRAELPNPQGRLRPEMFAQIRHEEAFATLPTVPAAAVIQSEGHSSVWRLKQDDLFEQVEVRTGRRDGDRIAILSGLNDGDQVVVDGVMLLRSGS